MRTETVAALLAYASTAIAAKAGLAWPWCKPPVPLLTYQALTSHWLPDNENTSMDPSRFSGSGKVSWMYNWETWRPANTK